MPTIPRKRTQPNTPWTKKRDQFIEAGLRVLEKEGTQTETQESESQEATFGQNVGQQLKEIEQRQKIIAQKLISDVLFHAKLGNLNETSILNITSQPVAYQFHEVPPYIHRPQQTYRVNVPSTSAQSSASYQEVDEFITFNQNNNNV